MKMKQIIPAVSLLAALSLSTVLVGCSASDEKPASSASASAQALPSDFPKDFTIAEGEISSAQQLGTSGWATKVVVADQAAQDKALEDLKQEGYQEYGSNESEGTRSYSLTNGTFNVTLVLKQVGDEYTVEYSIANAVQQ